MSCSSFSLIASISGLFSKTYTSDLMTRGTMWQWKAQALFLKSVSSTIS